MRQRAKPITRCIVLLFPILLRGQAPDLAPLLPAPSASTAAIRRLVVSGDVAGAAARIPPLAVPDRQLWSGILAILRNDPTTAIRTLRSGGEHPKVLGVAYYLARQYRLFRQQMDKAIQLDPADFGPYYYYGRHYDSDLDNCEQAVEWFRKALDRNPTYARAHAFLGGCLERLSHPAEAEQAYQASLSVPLSQLGMGRLELAAGNAKEALPWVEKAIAADPRNATAQKLAARVYEGLGRPADAIRALELAARAAPYDASIHYQLYRLHRAAGQQEKAAAALREFERVRGIYGSQPQ